MTAVVAMQRLRDGDHGGHPSGGCSQWGSGSRLRCGRSELETKSGRRWDRGVSRLGQGWLGRQQKGVNLLPGS